MANEKLTELYGFTGNLGRLELVVAILRLQNFRLN